MIGSHFYLNGKKTVLRGTHDFSHYHGDPVICPGDRNIAMDLLLHKKMGANCSRWPSDIRLHSKKIAQYCDQFGLMLSWAGFFEVWTQYSEAETLLPRDVREMIKSLRNHPSIVIWEMGDEALQLDGDYRRFRYHEFMIRLVAREDPTRPIIPNGCYCNELVDLIKERPYTGERPDAEDYSERRRRVLEEYPVFAHRQAVWDLHKFPYFSPSASEFKYIDEVSRILGGCKPTVYTEFGCDALPNPANVADIYGGFRWKENAYIKINRDDFDMRLYGKLIKQEDWRETQAFQAVFVCGLIARLRQHPGAYAAYYFATMIDIWTCYWGAADIKGNCKLGYYAAKSHMAPLFVSALHGGVTAGIADGLNITASNYGDRIRGATLNISVRSGDGRLALEKEIRNIDIDGDVAVTAIAHMELSGLRAGLYGVEYRVTGRDGESLGRMLEMAFFD